MSIFLIFLAHFCQTFLLSYLTNLSEKVIIPKALGSQVGNDLQIRALFLEQMAKSAIFLT